MTEFTYWALDAGGASTRGSIAAVTAADAALALRQRGIIAYHLEQSRPSFASKVLLKEASPSLQWRRDFLQKLATLTGAGVAIDRALQLIVDQAKSERHQKSEALLNAIRAGSSLASALQQEKIGFEDHEIALIRVGEQAGELPAVLEDLSEILERRAKIRSEISSALIYPIFLLVFAVVSVIIVSMILAPRIAPLFENNPDAIPISLRLMMALSDAIRNDAIVLLLSALLAAAVLTAAVRAVEWKNLLASTLRRFPLADRIGRLSELSRVCNVLAALLKSGASLQSAIGSSAAAAFAPTTKQQLLGAREAVQSGAKLATALKPVAIFDEASLQLVAVAEETNRLEPVLMKIASAKESEALKLLTRSMALLTPVLMVLTGILVGGVVMSVMQAILSANDLALQ